MKPELLSTKCKGGSNHIFLFGVCVRCQISKHEHAILVKTIRKQNDQIRSKERGAR